ncbi:MAG: hypothetical protein HY737_04650 [Candidatus Omnitrophica bacterium]|nr:hypothetical protein [Candidatus Omnitrophota bacterium]
MSTRERLQATSGLALGFILLGIIARLVPHPWNATPITTLALFSGTYLSRRWSLVIPLAAVIISDMWLGWHNTIPFTWGAFALTGALAWWVRPSPTIARIATGTLAGSCLFFLITNFGVWLQGELYPMSAAGLWQCYVAGIPFFRAMAIGDALYSAAFFGGYALATARTPSPIRG